MKEVEVNQEALSQLSIADLHQSILFLGHGYTTYHQYEITQYKKMQEALSNEIVKRINNIFIL